LYFKIVSLLMESLFSVQEKKVININKKSFLIIEL